MGGLIPLIWGVLGFILFTLPEGPLSRAYWSAVYLTCPSWRIEEEISLLLTPLLNGLMYAAFAAALALGFNLARRFFGRLN